MFYIEDMTHAEVLDGEYTTYDEAMEALKGICAIPWGTPPNISPCINKDCARSYIITELSNEWPETYLVEVTKDGVQWQNTL